MEVSLLAVHRTNQLLQLPLKYIRLCIVFSQIWIKYSIVRGNATFYGTIFRRPQIYGYSSWDSKWSPIYGYSFWYGIVQMLFLIFSGCIDMPSRLLWIYSLCFSEFFGDLWIVQWVLNGRIPYNASLSKPSPVPNGWIIFKTGICTKY